MSAKVHSLVSESSEISCILPTSAGTGSRTRTGNECDMDTYSSAKMIRPRVVISRQNSESLLKASSRPGSGRYRKGSIAPDNENGTTSVSRRPQSASSARRTRSNSCSSSSGKKRVSFTTPLIDPRPENITYLDSSLFNGENTDCLTEEELAKLQASDYSDPAIPRRMRNRRWRKYIPFIPYIPVPTFRSLFNAIGRRKYRYTSN